MKKNFIIILCCMFLAGILSAEIVNWKAIAEKNLKEGRLEDEGTLPETGMYYLVLERVPDNGQSEGARLGIANLEAKRRLVAYFEGENTSGVRTLEHNSATIETANGESRVYQNNLTESITAEVRAHLRAARMIGQILQGDATYLVLVWYERAEDLAEAMQTAMERLGNKDVVAATGIAATHAFALQEALRGAVEQVLGTVVVGYAKHKDQLFQHRLFSGTNGIVENYRILTETEDNGLFRVEIVAKVSRGKLLESYREYMEFLGDPYFYVSSNSEQLSARFIQFFIDLGIRVTHSLEQADYVIHCDGQYRQISHPVNQRKGIQLSLSFHIRATSGNEDLLSMTNDPRKSVTFTGQDPQRQMEICAEKAFEQMKEPLHQGIQIMVNQMVDHKFAELENSKD